MRMSAHKKFVLELRAPVERYETRSAAGCKPGTAREDDLGQMLEKKIRRAFWPGGRGLKKERRGCGAMQDRSTMTLGGYLYSVFWKFVVGYVWYRSLLFRPLAGLERKASLHILLWLTAAAVLAYANTFRTRILLILVLAAVLAAGLTAVMFWGRRLSRRRFRARVSRWKYLMVCTAVSASVCLIGSVGWHAFLEGELFPAAVKAQASAVDEAQAQTIASNISEVLKLQPEVWQDLTTAQRIDTMQTICNIEVYYLGLPCAVTVSGANLPENTLGSYDDSSRAISISIEHLENDPVEEVLDTLLHEIYHCYEHRLAEVYTSADPELQRLRLFRDAADYVNEVAQPVDPEEDYSAYAAQAMETDSRAYAAAGVQEYYDRIAAYMAQN